MKKRLGVVCVLMVSSICFAVLAKNFFEESNFERFRTIEDVRNSNIIVSDFEYEARFCGYEDVTAQDMIDAYIDFYNETAECILVVKPTGNIRFQTDTTMQEILIKEVIRGEESTGVIGWIILDGTRIETSELGKGKIELYSYAANLMLPEKEYLLFCNPCILSDYTDQTYFMFPGGMTYFALDNNECVAAVYEEGKYYRDYPQCEFYVETEKTIAAVTEFKNQVIEYFYYN